MRAAARGFVTRRKVLCGLTGFLGSSRPLLAVLPWGTGAGGPSCVPEWDALVLIPVFWLDWEPAGGNPVPAVPHSEILSEKGVLVH